MTTMAAYLEDFGSVEPCSAQSAHNEEDLENERLEAFDKGYRAGWDDAIKAKETDSFQITDNFAQKLQELSFTYHEVHAQVLANLGPIFDEVLQKILPAIAHDTLGAHISDQLSQAAREIGTVTIEIVVAPGAGDQVLQLVNKASSNLPITVSEAEAIGVGQAELRMGGKEMSIDLGAVCKQILDAVRAVLYEEPEIRAHG